MVKGSGERQRKMGKLLSVDTTCVEQWSQLHCCSPVERCIGQAGIKVLAVNAPIAGAPLYTADNLAAGRVAGEALAQFALRAWRGQPMAAARKWMSGGSSGCIA